MGCLRGIRNQARSTLLRPSRQQEGDAHCPARTSRPWTTALGLSRGPSTSSRRSSALSSAPGGCWGWGWWNRLFRVCPAGHGEAMGGSEERGVRVSTPQAPSEWTESRSQRRPVLLQSPCSDPWKKCFVDRPPRVLEEMHIIFCAISQELMIHFAHRQPWLVFLFFVLNGPADETLASDSHVMDCAECVAAISKKERNSGDIPSLPPRSLLDHGSHICCFLS